MTQLLKDRVQLIRNLMEHSFFLAEKHSYDAQRCLLEIVTDIRQDTLQHFLSYSQEDFGKVSYASKPEHRYTKRTKTTLARYLKRHYNLPIPEHLLMLFTRKTNADLFPNTGQFQILQGNELVMAYRYGFGKKSCMTGESSVDLLNLYKYNPDKVQILLFQFEGLAARALIWKCDCGHTIVDRIYPNDGPHIDMITRWANNNGYIQRAYQGAPTYTDDPKQRLIRTTDETHHTITLSRDKVKFFPYLDTFQWCHELDGRLVLSNYLTEETQLQLSSTEGSAYDLIECDGCHQRIASNEYTRMEDPMLQTGRVCVRCYNFSRWCEMCETRHTHTHIVRSEDGMYVCFRCFTENYTECPECGSLTASIYHTDNMSDGICYHCFNISRRSR